MTNIQCLINLNDAAAYLLPAMFYLDGEYMQFSLDSGYWRYSLAGFKELN